MAESKQQTNAARRREAAAAGDVHYVPSKPCPVCDATLRYVLSNQCVDCTKRRSRESQTELRRMAAEARRRKEGRGE